MPTSHAKRQNFDVTAEQDGEIAWLRDALGVSSAKDAVLRAVRIAALLSRKTQGGSELVLRGRDGTTERLVIPELERPDAAQWSFLVQRPHPWRRQLFIKGTRLAAATVWADVVANDQTVEQAAAEWDLPLDAVREAIRYCEQHRDLLAMEAREERQQAAAAGVQFAPVGR